ncbi:hypothetical protein BDF20DRAFT_887338 [Mycotypha africana]|uniref:uncharacterized protein n=1 Tax=Mycotypha africana TaxID=64632 RepID=UPI002300BA87|nr:uncharacterized protein BDF20DRAFT_887338 [Mycotypha africana]KAI8971934.1 hypothetical protein BDF20DRAFT_887338 [Mycotypha africana]
MYNDEDSSDGGGSYMDNDDVEHFINRCSICFDAQLDFCLQLCKDQFCLDCFRKYVAEVVKSSWGLEMTQIKCPVCLITVPKYEWSRYVPKSITEMYDKFNTPYRSYIRSCPQCEADIIPCRYSYANKTNSTTTQTSRSVCERMQSLISSCPMSVLHEKHIDHIIVKKWISIFGRFDWTEAKLPTMHKELVTDLLRFQNNHPAVDNKWAHEISLKVLELNSKSDIWKELQFNHIAFFPDMACPQCESSICLHCGNTTHLYLTCEQNLEKIMRDKTVSKEIRETVKWKLRNSRRCPKCSIMINRDEGCNKVDCSYCGFAFCWACKASWAEGCGFYRCPNISMKTTEGISKIDGKTSFVEDGRNNSKAMAEYKTELGVPNITNIQAKFNSGFFY